MRYWLLVLNDDEFTEQQAYEVEAVEPAAALPESAEDGDEVALAGAEGVFALGEVDGGAVAYRRRLQEPVKTAGTARADGQDGAEEEAAGWIALLPDAWEDLIRTLPAPERRSDWLVTLSMPIEAVDKAEAVRQFWSYIRSLGPKELPTFVSPYGRELEGTSFLLGVEHEQDPEE
ncbi:hypothetical protein [Glycomyces sp. NRRL B-16210]|uniref:hypothetical protein n=1 Tax=Glycomyces sp. NRRL B-16210 TaxID=1463821 RepID=UPI000689C29D|nr:hypothetical protein [Glycomyces sp. NRRL B-16210]